MSARSLTTSCQPVTGVHTRARTAAVALRRQPRPLSTKQPAGSAQIRRRGLGRTGNDYAHSHPYLGSPIRQSRLTARCEGESVRGPLVAAVMDPVRSRPSGKQRPVSRWHFSEPGNPLRDALASPGPQEGDRQPAFEPRLALRRTHDRRHPPTRAAGLVWNALRAHARPTRRASRS